MMLTPRPCQTLMAMMAGIAQNGSLTHRWGGTPNVPRQHVEEPALAGA